MEELKKKPPSSICRYKSILVDIQQTPIDLPKIETFKKNYRFSALLKKMNKLNNVLTCKKVRNRIYMTPTGTAENSYRDNSVFYATWRGLADENKEYKQKIKEVELQNYRISRLKRVRNSKKAN